MADIVYNMDGQSTGVVRAWQAVNTSIEEMLRTVGDITPASVKAEAAQKSLGATAERWLKQMRTPLDDHLKRMQELQQLLQAGNITQHEYSKGIALSVAEMKRAEEASDTYGAAAKAVLAELVTPQDRHNARLAHLNELRGLNKLTEDQYAAAVAKANEQLAKEDTTLQSLLADGAKLRASLVTPQDEYAAALKRSNQLLSAGEISESEYAAAVDLAKKNLDAQDQSLQAALRDAAKIKTLAVTPQEAYAKAIKNADDLLKKNLITKKEYNAELVNQEQLLKKAEAGERTFFSTALGSTGQVLATVTGVGSVIAGIAAVASQLRVEYQNLVGVQKTAADKQIDVAGAQSQAIDNLGNDPTMSVDQMNAEAQRIAKIRGVPLKNVYLGFANAFSAKGSLTSAQAVEAVDTTAAIDPHDLEALDLTAGALLDLMKKRGGTAKSHAGMILGGKQAARIVKTSAYAKNAIPAIFQSQEFGNTEEFSAALFATFTQGMGDQSGESSMTNMISFEQQLAAALKNRKDLTSTKSRLEFIKSDAGKSLRKTLQSEGPDGLKVEKKAWTTAMGLLSPDVNFQNELFEAAKKNVPRLEQGESIVDQNLKLKRAQPLQNISELKRNYTSRAEIKSINNISGAQGSVNREGLDEVLKASGYSDISRKLISAEFEARSSLGTKGSGEAAAQRLEAEAYKKSRTEFYDPMGTKVQLTPTAEALEQAKEFRELATVIRQLTTNIEANTKATQQNTVKPPVVVKPQKPISQPTKTPKSAALAAPGGR